jgi:hypothetical protein
MAKDIETVHKRWKAAQAKAADPALSYFWSLAGRYR